MMTMYCNYHLLPIILCINSLALHGLMHDMTWSNCCPQRVRSQPSIRAGHISLKSYHSLFKFDEKIEDKDIYIIVIILIVSVWSVYSCNSCKSFSTKWWMVTWWWGVENQYVPKTRNSNARSLVIWVTDLGCPWLALTVRVKALNLESRLQIMNWWSVAKWHSMLFTVSIISVAIQGWGLLKLRSLNFLLWKLSILKKYLLNSLNHAHICQVSPQLSCGDTWQIWAW